MYLYFLILRKEGVDGHHLNWYGFPETVSISPKALYSELEHTVYGVKGNESYQATQSRIKHRKWMELIRWHVL
jgi:hypothetical protein